MFDMEKLHGALKSGAFVKLTFTKVNGEKSVKLVAPWDRIPGADAPKGAREMSESNFRFYEWGRPNRFDAAAPGDWASCKVANIIWEETGEAPTPAE